MKIAEENAITRI